MQTYTLSQFFYATALTAVEAQKISPVLFKLDDGDSSLLTYDPGFRVKIGIASGELPESLDEQLDILDDLGTMAGEHEAVEALKNYFESDSAD